MYLYMLFNLLLCTYAHTQTHTDIYIYMYTYTIHAYTYMPAHVFSTWPFLKCTYQGPIIFYLRPGVPPWCWSLLKVATHSESELELGCAIKGGMLVWVESP